MKRFCKTHFTILLILAVLQSGCAKDIKPTDAVSNSAKESINAIVALKPDCKDVGDVCISQIDSITAICNLELDDLNKDVVKWKWSFWGLLIVIGVYIIKRVLK